MAAQLDAMARAADPSVIVAAQTLPARNASDRVLEKLGFRHVATIEHPEDETVWEWGRDNDAGARGSANTGKAR